MMRSALPLLPLALLLGACASTTELRQEPLDRGVERTYDAPFQSVLSAARQAVVDAGLNVETAEESRDGVWVIVGQKDSSAWSWGELVRVVVERRDETSTTVRVLTQRRLGTNIAADDDHSDSIFGAVALRLANGR